MAFHSLILIKYHIYTFVHVHSNVGRETGTLRGMDTLTRDVTLSFLFWLLSRVLLLKGRIGPLLHPPPIPPGSRFFLLRVDPFLGAAQLTGKQTESHNLCPLQKMAEKFSRCIFSP